MPKISAVMALYNTPYEYLTKTVESIINQSFRDFELLIVDDASTMQYEDFFKSFNDKRIKYIKLEVNAGPGNARNVGIKAAEGKYIAITDSDDIYMPQRFELQGKYLDNNPDISLISCAFKQSNNGKIPLVIEEDKNIKVEMLFNSQLANPAVMFRRDVFIENNLFYPEDINFGEDYLLWINAIFAGVKIENLSDVLMIYTRRDNQLSKTKAEQQADILKQIYKKIFLKIGFEASDEELDLHSTIYTGTLKGITEEEISTWFDKIIEHNRSLNILDEQAIIKKKNHTLNQYFHEKNRLFKIKIGKYNFCLSKDCKISFKKRY